MKKLLVGWVDVSNRKAEHERELEAAKRCPGFICGYVRRKENLFQGIGYGKTPRWVYHLHVIFDPALTGKDAIRRYYLKPHVGDQA